MYHVEDFYSRRILFTGSLVQCLKFKPGYHSLSEFIVWRTEDTKLVKIIDWPF